MTAPDSLREQFERALLSVGGHAPRSDMFDRLCAAYGEPQRHYHTLEHIESCLAWLNWAWSSAERPHEVLLALWYHDAVYEPLAHDNEAQSGALARRDLRACGVPEASIARIETLIMATKEHGTSKGDAALLTDIDLSILGADPPGFERFERQVRSEYASVEISAYARGRAAVLKRLASRSPLYSTPLLQEELSDRAAHNLSRAIAHWEAGGSPGWPASFA